MYWFRWSCGTLSDHISNHRGQITMDTQKNGIDSKDQINKTTKPGRYFSIILWLLHPKQINCPNLISWLNIIFLRFSEMDARGARSRVIKFNGGQLPSINGLSLYGGTRTLSYWPEILCKSVVWSGAPSDRKYRSLSPG